MTSALIRDFPEYYKLYSVREYRYNNITQLNRNRLLWLDPNVDGVKTGHTESAGYCLVGSATRNGVTATAPSSPASISPRATPQPAWRRPALDARRSPLARS